MSVREWAELCSKDEFRAPAKQDFGLESRNGRFHTTRAPPPRRGRKKETMAPSEPVVKEEPEETTMHDSARPSSVPSPPPSAGAASPPSGSRKAEGSPERDSKPDPKGKGKRVHQTREIRQANLADRAARDNQFINTFDPHFDWLPSNTNADDYTPEYCQKLERHYWRNCGLGKSAWYGADTQGLFDSG